jgi:fatty acid desaturase
MAEATNDLGEASTTESASATASTTEPGLMGMLIKDLAVIFAAVSLWAAADTWYVVTGMWLAQIVAVGDAILVGLLLASLFHEWGHYAGAVYGKSEVCRVTPKGLSLFPLGNLTDHIYCATHGQLRAY